MTEIDLPESFYRVLKSLTTTEHDWLRELWTMQYTIYNIHAIIKKFKISNVNKIYQLLQFYSLNQKKWK